MPCGCESCAAQAAIPPVPTFTRAFRRDCEARMVLGLPFDRRRDYLAEVERKRGGPARTDLESAVRDEFERRRRG